MKSHDTIALIGVFVALATLTIMFMQFRAQKELWAIQKEVNKVDLENKKQGL